MAKNSDYKNMALAALKGKWAPSVVATIIYFLIVLLLVAPGEMSSFKTLYGWFAWFPEIGSYVSFPLMLFVLFPVSVGIYNAFMQLYVAGDDAVTSNLFKFSLHPYLKIIITMLLMYVIVMVGFILLIIPGVILSYSYSMVPYIIKENPELGPIEILRRSRKMMRGHKFDLFWLHLSFIGWALLSMVTLGIGFFFLLPYMYTAMAAFWEDIKVEGEASGNFSE